MAEAWAQLSSRSGRIALLAGGTDLLVRLKQGEPCPELLVDIKELGLGELVFDSANGLTIGAAAPLNEVCAHTDVRLFYPALHQAAISIASHQIRNRATIGGNLCNAAPSADTAPPLIIYDATAVITGPGDTQTSEEVEKQITRKISVENFIIGPGRTVLLPAEILKEVRLPLPKPGSGSAYVKLSRTEKDIAIVGVAALVRVSAQGVCTDVRIALGAVAPTPIRALRAEELLQGRQLDDELLARAAATAASEASPIDDVRASATYRRDMIRELTRDALKKALLHCKRQEREDAGK
jgi:carbon-monoxide dehydrogenase medium subunit